MSERINRRILLQSRPAGALEERHFRLVEAPAPAAGAGEILVRTLYLSLDPYMRIRIGAARSYAPPAAPGAVMVGGIVGRVIESNLAAFAPGDVVEGRLGWQDFAIAAAGDDLTRVDPALAPLSTALGVLGMTGLTAYFGLLDVGRPRPGDTVVLSAAAGAVGSVAGQIARIMGCRVVGIAGGARKTRYLTDELGFDAAIDYRSGAPLGEALDAACPDGVDVYFDNVGGAVSDAVLDRLARGARVAVCGGISQYDLGRPELGPRVQGKLMAAWASMQAFNVFQFRDHHDGARRRLAGWLAAGRLTCREHVVDGLENAPRALIGLLRGENFGKLIVRVAGSGEIGNG